MDLGFVNFLIDCCVMYIMYKLLLVPGTKHPTKQIRKKGFPRFAVPGYSPSWWGGHSSGSLRQLITFEDRKQREVDANTLQSSSSFCTVQAP